MTFKTLVTTLVVSAVALCGVAMVPAASAAAPPAASTTAAAIAPLVIKVDGTLPASIDLEPGQQVIFIRKTRLVGSNVEVQHIQFDRMAPALFQVVNNASSGDPDYRVVAAYQMVRDGRGAIDVTHTAVVPNPTPRTQRIQLTVQAAARTVVINVDQGLPARLDLQPGQTVLFVRNKQFVGSSVKVDAVQTDRGVQGLFTSGTGHIGGQVYLVGGFKATRSGYGRIDVQHRGTFPGANWRTKSIKVVVN